MIKNIKAANTCIKDGFRAAFAGIKETILFEKSFRAMLIIGSATIAAMFYLPTSGIEKVALLAAIFGVLILELVNSTIERILDFISPEYDERVRIIKDLMAAIVLIASLGAGVIGMIILGPFFWRLFF
ncbi:MAG: diacylglycerol kinase [bacterium]